MKRYPLFLAVTYFFALAPSPAQATEKRDNTSFGDVRVEYLGLPHLSLSGRPIRENVLKAALEAVGATGSLGLHPVSFGGGGIRLAQAAPVMPGARGCGLLRVDIPKLDPQLANLQDNPDREQVVQLRGSDGYARLAQDVRDAFDSAWSQLEADFITLTGLVDEIRNQLFSANQRADELDGQACALVRLYDDVQPKLSYWNSVCRGAVPDDTYRWCMAEKQRLQPDVDAMQRGDQAMRIAAQDFASTYTVPIKEKHDRALGWYGAWESGVLRQKEQTEAAIQGNSECHNSLNIHFQLNKSHEYLQPLVADSVDVSAPAAIEKLIEVTAMYHAMHANNPSFVIGLGHATNDAKVWLGGVTTPPGVEKSFPFSLAAPGVWNLRLDISIRGTYPCPEKASTPRS